jgi:hypothetical protein
MFRVVIGCVSFNHATKGRSPIENAYGLDTSIFLAMSTQYQWLNGDMIEWAENE